ALTLTMAFRFIPTIAALYQNVQEAHSLRAAGDHRGGFFRRILPQLTAVFIQSIRMVPSLAMALEIRGVGRSTQRTQWRSLPQGGRPASWVATAALALAVYVPVAFGLLS
ncbi:MAG TPA: energy-coupling factor transporter transmembrane component T, partial [bacterium]|nr:energy-coupling factor transporter transmembrane component T [bacterium]